jgi:predicted NBD/HSP70 family sugar kinase
MVNPMISSGLLRETTAPAEESKGAGRPRMMLEFVAEAYYICGVDTGPYRTNYILTDLLGNIIAVRRTNQPLGEYQVTLERFAREIPDFLDETGIPREKILGVGICLPGMIDGNADKIYDIFQEGWTEHSISTELGERLGLKVEVENNVRARAISAELFDRMVKAEPFAYFFVSFGIACQMIIDGKVLYGQSAAAGEIGHTVVQRNGPVCPTCGNRGCLEALTGERAILQQCRDIMATDTPTVLKELCRDSNRLTMDQVLEAQKLGDKAVSQVIEDAIEYLGIALANTINLISPRSVVLEGRILSTPTNQERMLRIVDQYMFHIHSGMTDFTFLPYDPDRGARAAASVVVKEFLGRPL